MISIGNVMTKDVMAVRAYETARKVLLLILSRQYSGMPVVDEENRVIGVISEFDLLKAIRRRIPLDITQVGEIMSKNPIVVEMNAPMENVIDTMIANNIIRLPVVEGGKLVGIVSRSDLLLAYYEIEDPINRAK